MEKIPVLIYTDIGDDIDDTLALTYLVGCTSISIVWIVCAHKNVLYSTQIAKKLLDQLGVEIPVFSLDRSAFFVHDLEKYRNRLVVLSIGPTTQLYQDLVQYPQFAPTIKRIYFQGQVGIDKDIIFPDIHSYNFAQDIEAISEILQYDIPMTFVGKFVAYECPFYEKDILALANYAPGVWTFLVQEAHYWQEKFSQLNSSAFERIYGEYPEVLSFPYDLLTAMVIIHPEQFVIEKIWWIELIGEVPDKQSIKSVKELRLLMK